MAKSLKQIIAEIRDDAKDFLSAEGELLKLQAIEKGIPAAIRGGYYLILGVMVAGTLLFLLVLVALLFAMLFASGSSGDGLATVSALAAGFGCLVGLLVLIDLILLLCRKPIFRSLERKLISGQLDRMEAEEEAAAERERVTVVTPEVVSPEEAVTVETSSSDPDRSSTTYRAK